MVFKSLRRAFGVGGPTVDTVLDSPDVQPGGYVSGQVRFAGGDHEVANVGTISSTMADGSVVHTDLVITYYIDDDGLVTALRAYWELDKLRFG